MWFYRSLTCLIITRRLWWLVVTCQMTNIKTDPDQDSGDGGDGRQDHIRHLEQSADKCRGYY